MIDLVFVKLTHAEVTNLSEVSRGSSEIFEEILFFLCFSLDNCSQMYVLPKTDDMNEV